MTDRVILNGKVITFDGQDAEALAIKGNTIEAVGSTEDIRAMAGGATEIDAAGATVLPGFIDSHVHLFGGSAELQCLNLAGVIGEAALGSAVKEFASQNGDSDDVMLAASIDYHAFGDRDITRQDLDKIAPDRPFAAIAADHHTVWANTKALEMAGLLQGASVPDGSEVVMAQDGSASGELRETGAFEPVLALTEFGGRDLAGYVTGKNPKPAATAKQRISDKAVIARGLKHCASFGITGLHNMDGNYYQLELLSELKDEGSLLCRTEVPMHLKGTDSLDRLREASDMQRRFTGEHVWCNRVKMFMDGVIDSRTAYMLEPYPGTEDRSKPLFSVEQFNEACVRIDAMKLQIAVHAIGDAAVRQTLDGFAAARQIATAFAWRLIRATGAPLIFSTDWPVVPVDVMPSIKGAVSGCKLPSIWPDQQQSLRDALASYTRDNAWVEFNEQTKGRLSAGMRADIVVMNRDLEALPVAELDQANAAHTICDGRITYQA